MRERTPKRFLEGMKAKIRTGSPVRQWMFTLEAEPRALLTPTQYMAPSPSNRGPEYVEVQIARIMPPYAIVYHHDGQGWVRLWLDMRQVRLEE
jgi:hypothetical protein